MARALTWTLLVVATGCGFSNPPRTMYVGSRGRPIDIAFPVEKYSLPNGLGVLLAPDRHLPEIAVDLVYGVGSADDPADKAGLAHLYEHLMFDGSRHVPSGKFMSYLDAAGATDGNGFTAWDVTTYQEVVPSSQLDLVLWLESDRLGFFDPVSSAELDRERSVVEMERRSRSDEAWLAHVEEQLYAAAFPEGHPYHRPVAGSAHTLDGVRPQDVAAFGATYYVPGNATLTLVGDFDVPTVKRSIERYFGPIPGARRPEPRAVPPVHLKAKRIVMEAAIATAEVIMGWMTPALGAGADADLATLISLIVDKLYEPLQKEQHIAAHWTVGRRTGRLGSLLLLHAKAAEGVSVEKLEQALDQALRAFVDSPPNVHWVSGTTYWLTANSYFGYEGLLSRAESISIHDRIDGSPSYLQEVVSSFGKVTTESSRQTAAAFLAADRRLTLVVEPNPSAPTSGRLKGAR